MAELIFVIFRNDEKLEAVRLIFGDRLDFKYILLYENYMLSSQIKNIMGNQEIYVLKNNNANSYYDEIMSDKSYIPKFQELTDAALAIQDRILVMNNVNTVGIDYKHLDVLEVSDSFFEKYEIKDDFTLHRYEGDMDSLYFFLYGCQFLVDDISELDKFMSINNEERILETYLVSYTKQLEYIGNEYLNSFVLEGILGICLFVFAFAGMICTMFQRIADNAYEYAVNILCGAKLTDIYARIIMEFVMIIMTGVIVTICIFRISLASLGIVSLAFLCFLIMCLFAKYKIDFESLVENLRSKG